MYDEFIGISLHVILSNRHSSRNSEISDLLETRHMNIYITYNIYVHKLTFNIGIRITKYCAV